MRSFIILFSIVANILAANNVFAQNGGSQIDVIFREDRGYYVFRDSTGSDAYSMVLPEGETDAVVSSFINSYGKFIYSIIDYSNGKLDGVGSASLRGVPISHMYADKEGWELIRFRNNVSVFATNGPYIVREGDSLMVVAESEAPPGIDVMEVSSSAFTSHKRDPSLEVRLAVDEFLLANGPKMYDVVAPRLVEEPARMEQYLEALIPDIDTLGTLGWASDYTVTDRARSLTVRALADLEILGDSLGAREAMEEMHALAEAEKDISLSPEAYSLLRYNAEYLLDRLPMPAPAFERLSAGLVIDAESLAGGTLVSNNFRIDGRDHDLAGEPTNTPAVSGIATTAPVRDYALATLPPGRIGNITGSGPAPDIAVAGPGLALDSLIAAALAHPDLVAVGRAAPATLGTEAAPVVAYASGRVDLPEGFRGVGVLVADESVHFYEGAEWRGLILIRGSKPELRLRSLSRILGGAALTGGPSDLRLYDQAAVLRSAAALGLAQQALDATP